MPKYEQSFALNTDNKTALAIAYQAFKDLDWNIDYAGDMGIVGSLKNSWGKKGQQVICRIDDKNMVIISESQNNEMMDLAKKNKKNTDAFVAAYNAATALNETAIEQNKTALNELRAYTMQKAAQEKTEAEEVAKALNLNGSNLYVTYGIIAINVLMFVLMVINGAGIIEANGVVHIRWGSNYTPLTLSGDWWRLVSNIFIHFGIIHLLLNMYCLYTISVYLEPLLGKTKYIIAYIGTGILASLTSLWWHKDGVNSAGASGAIFGMYGLFLAFLTTQLVPKSIRGSLLQSIGIFIIYNLVFGLKSGVDNAAHIGGVVSGFIIGYCFVPVIKKEREQQQQMQWIPYAVLVAVIAIAFGYLQQNAMPKDNRAAVLQEIKNVGYKDHDRFNDKLLAFGKVHDSITVAITDSTLTNDVLLNHINTIAIPGWQQQEQSIQQTTTYDLSAEEHAKAAKLLQYILLRKEEAALMQRILTEPGSDNLLPALKENRAKSRTLFSELVNM